MPGPSLVSRWRGCSRLGSESSGTRVLRSPASTVGVGLGAAWRAQFPVPASHYEACDCRSPSRYRPSTASCSRGRQASPPHTRSAGPLWRSRRRMRTDRQTPLPPGVISAGRRFLAWQCGSARCAVRGGRRRGAEHPLTFSSSSISRTLAIMYVPGDGGAAPQGASRRRHVAYREPRF